MKGTRNLMILAMVMAMLVAPVTKVCASANPQRATVVNATYSTGNLPKEPMLNALVDDPKRGDEQDFVYVTNENGKPVRGLKAEREYQIHIYYHAVVSSSSTQEYVENAQLLLRNFPSGLMSKNDRRTMTATLSWGNTGGQRYYRQCNHNLIAKEDLVCNLGLDSFNKANQAVFNTAGDANGKNVSFGSLSGLVDKCLLGYDRLDGVVPCGEQYAGEVIVNFTTSKAQASGAAGLRAEATEEPSMSENQEPLAQDDAVSDDSAAPESDRELTTREFSRLNQWFFTCLSEATSAAQLEKELEHEREEKGTLVGIVAIALILLIVVSVMFWIDRGREDAHEDVNQDSQSAYEEYQQSVREAASAVVIEALNVAAKSMHDRGKANLWQAVHILIEPAMRRLVLSESTEDGGLLAEALENGCRICFDDDLLPDEPGHDDTDEKADWKNYDDCVEPQAKAGSEELEAQSQTWGEDGTTVVDERTVYLPAGLHFTSEELIELGKMTDCRPGDVNFGFAGIHQLSELIEASDYCPKGEFWQKLEEILQEKLRAFKEQDASDPEVEAEITKLVDAMQLVQQRKVADELSAGIDTTKDPAIQINASGKSADGASLDDVTADNADQKSTMDFVQGFINEADRDDAALDEQHAAADSTSESGGIREFGAKQIREWARESRTASEERPSKDES